MWFISVADVVTVDVLAAKDLLDSGHRYLDVRLEYAKKIKFEQVRIMYILHLC